jgi:hypothetical protein
VLEQGMVALEMIANMCMDCVPTAVAKLIMFKRALTFSSLRALRFRGM